MAEEEALFLRCLQQADGDRGVKDLHGQTGEPGPGPDIQDFVHAAQIGGDGKGVQEVLDCYLPVVCHGREVDPLIPLFEFSYIIKVAFQHRGRQR